MQTDGKVFLASWTFRYKQLMPEQGAAMAQLMSYLSVPSGWQGELEGHLPRSAVPAPVLLLLLPLLLLPRAP